MSGEPDRARIDVRRLSATEREGVALLLRVERVDHRFGDGELIVARSERDRATELVELAAAAPRRLPGERGDPLVGDPGTGGPTAGPAPDGPLAGPGRRAAGAAAEVGAGALVAVLLARRLGTRRAVAVAATAWSVVGHLGGVALTGRTPGLLVAGARVRRPPSPGAPGGRAALARWAVADGPVVGAAVAQAVLGRPWRVPVTGALLAVAAAVRAPVLTDPWRRGRHDHRAGTVVTCTGPDRRAPGDPAGQATARPPASPSEP